MRTIRLMAITVLIAGGGLALHVAQAQQTGSKRTDIYVIEGTLEYEIEGQPPARVKPGDVLFVPAGKIHTGKNVGSGNGAELATYVVEKGKPLITVVK